MASQLTNDDGSIYTVTIKVLRHDTPEDEEEEFIKEVRAMNAFRHENILSLIGIAEPGDGYKPWILFEYMVHGDLAEVLRLNSPHLKRPIPGLEPLTEESLLLISQQIATGMKYLAAQNYIHKDLACRNCLGGPGLSVKISDFGMSRDVYMSDYYRIANSKPIPLRWMFVESVMYRRHTLQTDVWSYGVVLWEIYTYGKQPYYDLTNDEVLKRIVHGHLLTPPENCPSFIRQLMYACWRKHPAERISFDRIYDILEKFIRDTMTHDELIFIDNTLDDVSSIPSSPMSSVFLATPPDEPVDPHFPPETEMLDVDNYLSPRLTQTNEYLKPLPQSDSVDDLTV